MTTTHKTDKGGQFDLLLEPIKRRSPLGSIPAIKLLRAHGLGLKAAKAAIESPMAGVARAVRLPHVADPKALLDGLAAEGFPARAMAPAPSDKQIAAWAADDTDMADALKGDFVATKATLVQSIRRRLNLSQAQFAEQYGIPVHCIRAWEISRQKPDAATLAYLEAISGDPSGVARALAIGRAGKARVNATEVVTVVTTTEVQGHGEIGAKHVRAGLSANVIKEIVRQIFASPGVPKGHQHVKPHYKICLNQEGRIVPLRSKLQGSITTVCTDELRSEHGSDIVSTMLIDPSTAAIMPNVLTALGLDWDLPGSAC
jgi:putative transcriptional regulator